MTYLSIYSIQVETPPGNVSVSTFIFLLALFPQNWGGRKVLRSPKPNLESAVTSVFGEAKCYRITPGIFAYHPPCF